MRYAAIIILLLILLVGCSYSAKSVITVRGEASQMEAKLEGLVMSMRRHREGCFSERYATMVVSDSAGGKTYQLTNSASAMDLSLGVDPIAGMVVELNEWSEESFSPYVAECYQSLLKELVKEFGKEQISILESCKAGSCR